MDFSKRIVTEKMLNVDLCKMCGGHCCKSYPCEYYPSDFKEITEDGIAELIDNKVAVIDYVDEDGIFGLARFSFLVLRARGKFDLKGTFAGFKTRFNDHNRCVHLESNGCALSTINRPGEGLYLVPDIRPDEGFYLTPDRHCYLPKKYAKQEKMWYQNPSNQEILYDIIREHGEAHRLEPIQDRLVLQKTMSSKKSVICGRK